MPKNKKEGKPMATALEKKFAHLKDKLNAISEDAPVRRGSKGMIELDPNNQHHAEWFEHDKYKGE